MPECPHPLVCVYIPVKDASSAVAIAGTSPALSATTNGKVAGSPSAVTTTTSTVTGLPCTTSRSRTVLACCTAPLFADTVRGETGPGVAAATFGYAVRR